MKKIFIHVPKNAGTNFWKAKIAEVILPNWNMLRITQEQIKTELDEVELRSTKAIGHARVRDFNPDLIKKCQPFCVVRNPWSRMVSQYEHFLFWTKREQLNSRNKLAREDAQNRMIVKTRYEIQSFKDWLFTTYKLYKDKNFTWLHASESFWTQKSYMIDDDGSVVCDVLRFENFNEELTQYLNIKEIRRENVGKKVDYKEYYDDDLLNFVGENYKEDIDYFGFDFNSTATRNCYEK